MFSFARVFLLLCSVSISVLAASPGAAAAVVATAAATNGGLSSVAATAALTVAEQQQPKEYDLQEKRRMTLQIIKEVETEVAKNQKQYFNSLKQQTTENSNQPSLLRRRTSTNDGASVFEGIAAFHQPSTGMSKEQMIAFKLAQTFGDGVDGGARRFTADVKADPDHPEYFSAKLTLENTQPMKYYVSIDNFDPKKARKYTTCFNVGDWYYQGAESTKDGPPSKPTCPESKKNDPFNPDMAAPCWGICKSEDVWDPRWNEGLKAYLQNGAKWLETRLMVPKLKTRLKLATGPPTHQAWIETMKWTGKEAGKCGADIFYTCKQPPIDESWCSEGLPEGITNIVFLTLQPVFRGGGSGGPCAFDANGRPIAQVINMHQSMQFNMDWIKWALEHFAADAPERRESTGWLHELIHGVGFDSGTFHTRHMLQENKFPVFTGPDKSGTQDDTIMFLRPETKTSTLAKVHFDCNDDEKWQGLPLMGTIEKGGYSHHNSFVSAESILSYTGYLLSPFDMAILEDTGYYIINWNKVDVPNWGAYRGCDFVSTRCRTRSKKYDDAYTIVASQEECNGKFMSIHGGPGWPSGKLVYDRCGNLPDSPENSCGLKNKCHPECIKLTDDLKNLDEYLKWRPIMNATGFNGTFDSAKFAKEFLKKQKEKKEALQKQLIEGQMQQIVFGVLTFVFTMSLGCVLNTLFTKCSLSHIVCCSHGMSIFLSGFGITVIGFSIKLFIDSFLFGHLFLSKAMLVGLGGLGLIIVISGVLQYKVAMSPSSLLFYLTLLFSLGLILIQVSVGIAFMAYSQSLPSLTQNEGDGGRGKFDGFGMGAFAKFDNFACESYRTCCYGGPIIAGSYIVNNTGQDQGEKLPFNYTSASSPSSAEQSSSWVEEKSCLASHPGENGLIIDSMDPSRQDFCKLISGVDSSTKYGIQKDSCNTLDSFVDGFDRQLCQTNFCVSGVDGFTSFQNALISWVYGYSMWLGMVCIVSWFFQLLQLRILKQLYTIHKYEKKKVDSKTKNIELNKI